MTNKDEFRVIMVVRLYWVIILIHITYAMGGGGGSGTGGGGGGGGHQSGGGEQHQHGWGSNSDQLNSDLKMESTISPNIVSTKTTTQTPSLVYTTQDTENLFSLNSILYTSNLDLEWMTESSNLDLYSSVGESFSLHSGLLNQIRNSVLPVSAHAEDTISLHTGFFTQTTELVLLRSAQESISSHSGLFTQTFDSFLAGSAQDSMSLHSGLFTQASDSVPTCSTEYSLTLYSGLLTQPIYPVLVSFVNIDSPLYLEVLSQTTDLLLTSSADDSFTLHSGLFTETSDSVLTSFAKDSSTLNLGILTEAIDSAITNSVMDNMTLYSGSVTETENSVLTSSIRDSFSLYSYSPSLATSSVLTNSVKENLSLNSALFTTNSLLTTSAGHSLPLLTSSAGDSLLLPSDGQSFTLHSEKLPESTNSFITSSIDSALLTQTINLSPTISIGDSSQSYTESLTQIVTSSAENDLSILSDLFSHTTYSLLLSSAEDGFSPHNLLLTQTVNESVNFSNQETRSTYEPATLQYTETVLNNGTALYPSSNDYDLSYMPSVFIESTVAMMFTANLLTSIIITPLQPNSTIQYDTSSYKDSTAQNLTQLTVSMVDNTENNFTSAFSTEIYSLSDSNYVDVQLTLRQSEFTASQALLPTSLTSLLVINSTSTPVKTNQCVCECIGRDFSNLTESVMSLILQDKVSALQRILAVDEKTTSKYIRSKTSAHDSRPSSRNIGIFAILIICLPFVFVILADLFNVGIKRKRRRFQTKDRSNMLNS